MIVLALLLSTLLSTPLLSAAVEENVEHGRRLYEKSCLGCHAPDAAGDWFKAIPALAGQRDAYLQHQLDAFARGSRKSASMHWALKRRPLNHVADRAALILYLSTLPPQEFVSSAVRGDEALGLAVYASRCADCHGADAMGIAPQPIISHQHYSYLVDRLRSIRRDDSAGIAADMKVAVQSLTDSQVAAVANTCHVYLLRPRANRTAPLPGRPFHQPQVYIWGSNWF